MLDICLVASRERLDERSSLNTPRNRNPYSPNGRALRYPIYLSMASINDRKRGVASLQFDGPMSSIAVSKRGHAQNHDAFWVNWQGGF
jgi:hypothetical protein